MVLDQALEVIANLQQGSTKLQAENVYLRGQLVQQFQQLQEQFKLMELLQARLNQNNSSNSSKPPSSNGPGVKLSSPLGVVGLGARGTRSSS